MTDHSRTTPPTSSLEGVERSGSGTVADGPQDGPRTGHSPQQESDEERHTSDLRNTDERRGRLALGEPDIDGQRSDSDPGDSEGRSLRALNNVGIRIG